jgi:uncharacterized 2Fe-2S/4Fe-4S cluster protein (DUF4445 family)
MAEAAKQIKITFEPTGRSVWVLPGTLVSEAAARCGLALEMPCGGTGTCGKCRVRFVSNAPEPTKACLDVLDEAELAAGWRLACQIKANRDKVITIPETSRFRRQLQILTDSEAIIEKSADDRGDGDLPADIKLAGGRNFAVAFDVGTTTLVGELLSLPDGAEQAIAAGMNPQVSFGDDVVSRIKRAMAGGAFADELRDAIRGALDTLIDELCEKASVSRDEIRAVSFSGNTTMQHLLCGFDVSSLSVLPFSPARYEAWSGPAAELGLAIGSGATAYVLPVIGGFVGGDTVAGILSTRMAGLSAEADGPVAMIDIGTNGEIVLAVGGQLYAASAAAGPAFEGARISSGMRAATGAIEKVVFNDDVRFSVIGGAEPIGICGSALVDVAAGLLRAKLMNSTGRILSPEELDGSIQPTLRNRLRKDRTGQWEFALTRGDDNQPDVTIQQRDIRELQLAAGALRAGLGILLAQAGLTPSDLRQVIIAGGFGSFIRRANAQRIGLIPAVVRHEHINYVGNASLHGAKWVLVSAAARARAEQLATEVKHVELSADMDFQSAFAESMIFPEE